jgi:hypothetical protein
METDYERGDPPVAIGEIVQYFGSQKHGLYEITEHRDPADHPYAQSTDIGNDRAEWILAYPDGKAYVIWPVGVPRTFGNADQAVNFVRRTSFRVTGRQVLALGAKAPLPLIENERTEGE